MEYSPCALFSGRASADVLPAAVVGRLRRGRPGRRGIARLAAVLPSVSGKPSRPPSVLPAASLCRADYRTLARRTARRLDGGSFFSGTVSWSGNGFRGRLALTLIVRRTPGRRASTVALWYELRTFSADGWAVDNDFDFSRFDGELSPLL